MKRIAWITDIHLDFVSGQGLSAFCGQIKSALPDLVLLGGDISIAPTLREDFRRLEVELSLPIYFVLGNHDFYQGSITSVRSLVASLSDQSKWLRWLTRCGVVPLTETACLIGHDGWADGRMGNASASRVMLNDYLLINELAYLPVAERFDRLHRLGDEAAAYIKQVLPEALEKYQQIILVTHVPPFRQACWHEGQISDDEFLPHFTCQAVGDVLMSIMQQHPDRQMLVLCGHTHGSGEATILPNLRVITGRAQYGVPQMQSLLEVE